MASVYFVQPAEANIALIINNNTYHAEPSPEIKNGRVYVPLRTISEGLGFEVQWNKDSRSVSILSSSGSHPIIPATSGPVRVFINGEYFEIEKGLGEPYIKNPGYTMIPLRAVSEGLGAEIKWLDGLVTVNSEKDSAPLIEKEASNEKVWRPGQLDSNKINMLEDNANDKIKKETVPLSSTAKELSIFGSAIVDINQVNRYLGIKEAQIKQLAAKNGRSFVPFPENIGELYLTIAQKYGLRGDVALAQAMQETGYFQYGNEVLPSQNNYCGLGAIGRRTTKTDLDQQVYSRVDWSNAYLTVGLHGWSYKTPAIGVEAHLQHLYSYATTAPLPAGTILYDGRFNHGNRGKAKFWSDLNGRWAVPGKGYGETIVEKIWREMVTS